MLALRPDGLGLYVRCADCLGLRNRQGDDDGAVIGGFLRQIAVHRGDIGLVAGGYLLGQCRS